MSISGTFLSLRMIMRDYMNYIPNTHLVSWIMKNCESRISCMYCFSYCISVMKKNIFWVEFVVCIGKLPTEHCTIHAAGPKYRTVITWPRRWCYEPLFPVMFSGGISSGYRSLYGWALATRCGEGGVLGPLRRGKTFRGGECCLSADLLPMLLARRVRPAPPIRWYNTQIGLVLYWFVGFILHHAIFANKEIATKKCISIREDTVY